jgi:hypothetical protein
MDAAIAPQVVGIGMDYRENDRPPELFKTPTAWRAKLA